MFSNDLFINQVLSKCLDNIQGSREFYLSEDDFKFSFAQALIQCEAEEVVLEYPISNGDLYSGKPEINSDSLNGDKSKIDVRFTYRGQEVFIELKYKQLETVVTRYGQEFKLRNQSAQTIGLYAFHLDIERMEAIKNSLKHKGCLAYCVFITNDQSYMKPHKGAMNKRLALCHGENSYYTNKGIIEYRPRNHSFRTIVIDNSYEAKFCLFKKLDPQGNNSQFWTTIIDLQHPMA